MDIVSFQADMVSMSSSIVSLVTTPAFLTGTSIVSPWTTPETRADQLVGGHKSRLKVENLSSLPREAIIAANHVVERAHAQLPDGAACLQDSLLHSLPQSWIESADKAELVLGDYQDNGMMADGMTT